MYGGGQFELGIGRTQIQELASLFHPDMPNDVAPAEFNEPEIPRGVHAVAAAAAARFRHEVLTKACAVRAVASRTWSRRLSARRRLQSRSRSSSA